MFLIGLKGAIVPPAQTFESMPPAPTVTVPSASAAPLIATFEEETPTKASPPIAAPSCPCSDQCTCGCQSGNPCQCAERSVAASVPQVSRPIPSTPQRDWRIGGQAWTRQSILAHLYGQDGNTNHTSYPRGSLDHLSLNELQAIHNADHEAQPTTRMRMQSPATRVFSSPQPRMILRSSSSCPNGVCPTR